MFTRPLRTHAVIAAAALPAMLLLGCGSNSPSPGASSTSNSDTSPAAGSPSSSDASVAALGRTTLKVSTRPKAGAPATTRTLTCNPVGGTVTDPAGACTQLAGAGGAKALGHASRPGMACTQQVAGTDVASVSGTVQGRRVSASLSQTDGCRISQWDSLSALLGSKAGGN